MPSQHDRSSLRRFVVAATVALMVLGACASGSSTASAQGTAGGAPKTGGTLTVGVSADITSFDPSFRTIQNYAVAPSLYDSLIRYDASLKPVPGLATSWKIADDNASIAIRLRQGVKFHSGKLMTADDVVKNVEKGKDTARCQHMCNVLAGVKSAQALDAQNVFLTFVAPQPTPTIFDILETLFIIDPAGFSALSNRPAGTGPFKLTEWVPRSTISLERNRDYWGTAGPYLDRLVFKVFDDVDAMVAALQTQSIDMIYNLPHRSAARLKDNYNIVVGNPDVLVYDWRLNTQKPPLDKKEVRQALQYAVNREGIVKQVLFGLSASKVSPYGKAMPGHDDSLVKQYAFDLAKAKDLLTRAGAPTGSFEITFSTALAGIPEMAQIIQSDLSKIGWTVKLLPVDNATAATYFNIVPAPYQSSISFALIRRFPPAIVLGSGYRLTNNGHWPNGTPPKAYVDAVAEANKILDPERQRVAFQNLERAIVDEAWIVNLAANPLLSVLAKNVSGIAFNPDNMAVFEHVSLNK